MSGSVTTPSELRAALPDHIVGSWDWHCHACATSWNVGESRAPGACPSCGSSFTSFLPDERARRQREATTNMPSEPASAFPVAGDEASSLPGTTTTPTLNDRIWNEALAHVVRVIDTASNDFNGYDHAHGHERVLARTTSELPVDTNLVVVRAQTTSHAPAEKTPAHVPETTHSDECNPEGITLRGYERGYSPEGLCGGETDQTACQTCEQPSCVCWSSVPDTTTNLMPLPGLYPGDPFPAWTAKAETDRDFDQLLSLYFRRLSELNTTNAERERSSIEVTRLVDILDRHGICADCGRTMERCEHDPNGRCI